MRRVVAFFVLIVLLMTTAFAHSGRTDSSGGHRDNNNVSGLGYYHFHHGNPPHLHTNGICEYRDDYSSRKSSVSDRYHPSVNMTDSISSNKSNDISEDIYFYIIIGVFIFAAGINYLYKRRQKIKDEVRRRLEEKRIREEYIELYEGKNIGEIVHMPNDVEIGGDGLPRERYSRQYWGYKYTFYISRTGKYYHRVKGCNNYATIATHAYRIHGLTPCRKCNTVLPDLNWYQEYLKILQIKKKYKIG